jgi:hypothetical protein
MPSTLRKPNGANHVVRRMAAAESVLAERFFLQAGYPVPLGLDFIAWGAWEHDVLVGCIALCREHNVSILRGPEVAHTRRKLGIGRTLLKSAASELANQTCYCVAYGFLLRIYRDAGFRRCAPGEGPDFLRRRVRDLNARGWDIALLVHSKR